MQVKVEYGLPGLRVGVDDDPETGAIDPFLLRRTRRRGQQAPQQQFLATQVGVQAGDVLFRNHEHMHRGLRVQVVESDAFLVFEEDPSRRLMSRDAAEDAAEHLYHSLLIGTREQPLDVPMRHPECRAPAQPRTRSMLAPMPASFASSL
jgi:hypothetical protein